MTRPKIKLELNKIDWAIEFIGLLGILLILFLLAMNYGSLPETLPQHFNASGKVDKYGPKTFIFLLPGIALVTYIGLTVLSRFPHIFNYPFQITNENAERQYKNGALMIRFVKALLIVQFLYITFSQIKIGLGQQDGLSSLFLPITLTALLITVIFFIYRGYKYQ
jgi:uncharacterized membrane protein